MLTCYSALLYLLAVYLEEKTVTPQRALEMTQMTPVERLRWLTEQSHIAYAHQKVHKLVQQYENFLENTNPEKNNLEAIFSDDEKSKVYTQDSYKFGDMMFDVLSLIGQTDKFYRRIVV